MSIFSIDRIALVDLRRHLEDGADLLALDGLEGTDRAAGSAGVGVLAGDEWHLVGGLHGRFLVVSGQHRGVAITLVSVSLRRRAAWPRN